MYVSIQCGNAGCDVTDLGITIQGGTVDPRCTDRGFVRGSSISGGVVCYNGTGAGSIVVYTCNASLNQVENETTRVCQSNGTWSGNVLECIPGMYCSQLHLIIT